MKNKKNIYGYKGITPIAFSINDENEIQLKVNLFKKFEQCINEGIKDDLREIHMINQEFLNNPEKYPIVKPFYQKKLLNHVKQNINTKKILYFTKKYAFTKFTNKIQEYYNKIIETNTTGTYEMINEIKKLGKLYVIGTYGNKYMTNYVLKKICDKNLGGYIIMYIKISEKPKNKQEINKKSQNIKIFDMLRSNAEILMENFINILFLPKTQISFIENNKYNYYNYINNLIATCYELLEALNTMLLNYFNIDIKKNKNIPQNTNIKQYQNFLKLRAMWVHPMNIHDSEIKKCSFKIYKNFYHENNDKMWGGLNENLNSSVFPYSGSKLFESHSISCHNEHYIFENNKYMGYNNPWLECNVQFIKHKYEMPKFIIIEINKIMLKKNESPLTRIVGIENPLFVRVDYICYLTYLEIFNILEAETKKLLN